MELCLFKGFNGAEGHAVAVGFKHNPFTLGLPEPKDLHERFDDVFHGVLVIIMEQDTIYRDVRGSALQDGF